MSACGTAQEPSDPGTIASSTTPPDPGAELREAILALASRHLSEGDPLYPQASMVVSLLSGAPKS